MTKKQTTDDADSQKRAARKAAIARLIADHPAEFAILMEEEHASRGVIWQRRLSPAERAQRDADQAKARAQAKADRAAAKQQKALEDLLAKHPQLRERFIDPEGDA